MTTISTTDIAALQAVRSVIADSGHPGVGAAIAAIDRLGGAEAEGERLLADTMKQVRDMLAAPWADSEIRSSWSSRRRDVQPHLLLDLFALDEVVVVRCAGDAEFRTVSVWSNERVRDARRCRIYCVLDLCFALQDLTRRSADSGLVTNAILATPELMAVLRP